MNTGNDTIAALATSLGEGSIAIIRVSGKDAFRIVDKVYKGKFKLSEIESHTINYGHIFNPYNNQLVDEVLVSVFKSPKSFTTEDVVEINCHGGSTISKMVLEAVLLAGARLSQPGEFTKRAFLNGRIDLSQAEAIMDLIQAKTEQSAQIAIKQSQGKLSILINGLRERILEMLAHLAVNVDYPEYDAEEVTSAYLLTETKKIIQEVEKLIAVSKQGKIYRAGIKATIIGSPNVGKSSLLNQFLQESKAIVTDIPGTTRDILEEWSTLEGIPIQFQDTAGIRETEDTVEKIGISRALSAFKEADLVLMMLNNEQQLSQKDYMLLQELDSKKSIIIINKIDKPNVINIEELKKISTVPIVFVSVANDIGLEELKRQIVDMFTSGDISIADDTVISNSRHIQLLVRAKTCLQDMKYGLEESGPIDMAEIDLNEAWRALGEIIGKEVHEDLLDQIFSKFCLGK